MRMTVQRQVQARPNRPVAHSQSSQGYRISTGAKSDSVSFAHDFNNVPLHSGSPVPSTVHEVIGSPGQQLDARTRAFFEPRYGRDFSQVRVHTGGQAADSARAVGAVAYTVGSQIAFADNCYRPCTVEGLRLLGHDREVYRRLPRLVPLPPL